MTTTKVFLNRKKSGNYIVSIYQRPEWETISICNSPLDLYRAIANLPKYSKIIKSEYSKSQLTTIAGMYTTLDCLKAFGIPATKKEVQNHFSELNLTFNHK